MDDGVDAINGATGNIENVPQTIHFWGFGK